MGESLRRYLLRLTGEISLKGAARGSLEALLVRNIRSALGSLARVVERVEGGRIYVEASGDVKEILARIFGVVEVLEVYVESSKDLGSIARASRALLCETLRGKRFAVRARRSGGVGYTSIDIARAVGAALLDCSSGVDLEHPEEEVYVEVRGGRAFISSSSAALRGPGGLPLGSSERLLSLFSGGFDSPVATWMVMKRGSPADLAHCATGSVENTVRALEVGENLVKRWSLGQRSRAYVCDFSHIVVKIRSSLRKRFWQPALRRAMYLVGSALMGRTGARAIVTGEAIWEAPSQRLGALAAVQKGLDTLILRPLTGFDKEEIMRLSRQLGLYSYSERVVESCFIGGSSALDLDAGAFLDEFSKLDTGIFEETASKALELGFEEENWRERVRDFLGGGGVSLDFIPEGAVVVDINRPRGSGGLMGIEDLEDLLRRGSKIVLVCELGEASEALARSLRGQGHDVYSLRGGYERLRMLRGSS